MADVCTAPSATLVLLRHGHSEGNEAGVFTGRLDVPLSKRGRAEALRAGALLVENGCEPLVVHTSTLVRAVDTATLVAGVVECSGRPRPTVRADPRLVERHYGALQGRSRAEVLAEHGAERVRRWRRGYRDVPPPALGNDEHPAYGHGHATCGESLADVRERVEAWLPRLVADLRDHVRVLVVGHSNSLRALCMVLDGLGEREVEDLNLPTGVPLRYDLGSDLRSRRRGGVYLDAAAARVGIAETLAQGRPRDGASL